MAEEKKKVSELDFLSGLTGQEFVEVVARDTEGSYKNYRVLADKLRVGASAFDGAVKAGFVGTEEEWLETLVGKSAYQIAVDQGYEGTEEQWVSATNPLFEILPENAGMVLTVNELGLPEWKVIDLSFANLDKVDNTADADKPISRQQKKELDRKLYIKDAPSAVMSTLQQIGVVVSEDGKEVSFDEGRATEVSELLLQHRRGSALEAAAWTGKEGTFFVDLENKKLYVHDGVTVGGAQIGGLTAAEVQVIIDAGIAIDKVTGLVDALAKKADLDEDGKLKIEQLPELDIPTKVDEAAVIAGEDDTGFATAKGIHALLDAIGFTKDENGSWKLDPAVVA
ncbi:hypothetical protein RVBP21_0420 [Pseudomonas phage BRkr]|nr:hypothetical protein RVBP21_0420 [Pseudomonas phage BRkr]